MTIEKAMQLIKGRFSYRLKHEFQYAAQTRFTMSKRRAP
jgi:hypothetical protein